MSEYWDEHQHVFNVYSNYTVIKCEINEKVASVSKTQHVSILNNTCSV